MRNGRYTNELLRLIEEYGLGNRHHDEVDDILFMHQQGMLTEAMAQAYLLEVEEWIRELERRPNYLARPPTFDELYSNGPPDLIVGRLQESQDVPLGLSLIGNMNSIFAGMAGSGKTTGLRSLIHAACKHNHDHPDGFVSVAVWDRKGGDYADLPQLGPEWLHLGYEQTLRIGLNAPEGVPPNIWINAIATTFAARAGLVASAVCLANMMRFLTSAMNPSPGQGQLVWPSFELLLDLAKAAPLTAFATKPDYEKSLIQMLEGVTHAGGDLFRTFHGLDLESIVRQKRCVILDVCGLGPPWVRALATDILLLQLLLGRQWRYQRRNSVDCLLVVDEADSDTSRKSEAAFPDLSPLSTLLKQGREYSLAVALGISAVGPTARQILTNASHHFFFAMSDAESLQEAKQTLLLPRNAEAILPALQPGECLYRGPGPWSHAMLAKLNPIASSRVARPSQYDSLPFTPSRRLAELPGVQRPLALLIAEYQRTHLRQAKAAASQAKDELPENARKLLLAISAHPWIPLFQLWPKMGLSIAFAAQQAARKALEEQKLIESKDVRIGRSNVILAWLTEKGGQAAGGNPFRATGRGGIVHAHFCQWLLAWARRQGHEAAIEWVVPGTNHPTDCAYNSSGEWHVFEAISECQDNVRGHLHACFLQSQAVAAVTIVTAQKGQLKALQAGILADADLFPFISRIHFDVIENYMSKEVSS